MKQLVFVVGLVLVLTVVLAFPEISRAQSNEIQTKGKVCPKPASPCVKKLDINDGKNIFEDWQLTFKLPAKVEGRRAYYSANFYAIILKSQPAVKDGPMDEPKCSQGHYSEEERKEVQKMFPANKVFASRNGCWQPFVWYTNDRVGEGINNFIAVYAGNTEAEAKRFLKQVKAKKEFADASYRKMQVVFGYGD
jgi:hypothetical protein